MATPVTPRSAQELLRQRAAQLLLLLWAWTLLLPLLHSLNHQLDHVHGPHGTGRSHYGLSSEHAHPHPHPHKHTDAHHQAPPESKKEPKRDAPSPAHHGDGSPEHFQAAFFAPDLRLEAPWLRLPLERVLERATEATPRALAGPWLLRCRGPPAEDCWRSSGSLPLT